MNTEKYDLQSGDVSFYHNQKEGDFNAETGEIYNAGNKEFENKRIFFDKGRDEKREGTINTAEHLRGVVLKINEAVLKEESKNNKEQQELLEMKKHEARELLLELLDRVGSYVTSIESMTGVKDSLKDPEKFIETDEYQKMLGESDYARKIEHNNLIDSVNIANRYIANNFGELNEEVIKKLEDREKAAGRKVLNVQRIKLPQNIVCPNNYDASYRKDVTRWAMNIHQAIVNLKPEIEKYQ